MRPIYKQLWNHCSQFSATSDSACRRVNVHCI